MEERVGTLGSLKWAATRVWSRLGWMGWKDCGGSLSEARVSGVGSSFTQLGFA